MANSYLVYRGCWASVPGTLPGAADSDAAYTALHGCHED